MGRTRADRRNSYAKRKKKAVALVNRWEGWVVDLGDGYRVQRMPMSQVRIGMMAGTRKLCSCQGCGNPRRHFGKKTVQERREFQGV